MPRVLIAEDNTANVLLIREFCKDMDFDPMVVEDGRAVIEAVRFSPPDLILMDIDAPVVDGLTATIEIRGLLNVSEQMMIIGLNSDSPATSAACRIAGMNQILSKPLQPERLMAALRAARAPLNLQATATAPEQSKANVESDEVLRRRIAEVLGPVPANTPAGRLQYINAQKLAGQFADEWADIAATVEMVTLEVIEQHGGGSVICKKFGELDFILMTPGLTEDESEAKCQSITKEICHTLAGDEAGAKFHIRTVILDTKAAVRAAEAAVAAEAASQAKRCTNPDILPWTSLRFWPAWETQRRKFPIHAVRAELDANGRLLAEGAEALNRAGPEHFHATIDISTIAELTGRLEGYETLEQPRLLSVPLHLHTLEDLPALTRYLRYMEKIPKKIRERLIIEIHGVPNEMRAVQIAELQKPILPHCLHTMLVVPPSYSNFAVLKQISGQIIGLKLPAIDADAEPDLAALKQFGMRAKQAGLTVAASMVSHRLHRDWGLTSSRYVLGPAIAAPQVALGPNVKFIA
jgi:CheY-like chemotaxis protein